MDGSENNILYQARNLTCYAGMNISPWLKSCLYRLINAYLRENYSMYDVKPRILV